MKFSYATIPIMLGVLTAFSGMLYAIVPDSAIMKYSTYFFLGLFALTTITFAGLVFWAMIKSRKKNVEIVEK